MSTRQKIVTHISIAAVFSIGLLAFAVHCTSITSHSIELELIQINNPGQSPSVNSIGESDALTGH